MSKKRQSDDGGSDRTLEWEEFRCPAFGTPAGPFMVNTVRQEDRTIKFQVLDADGHVVAEVPHAISDESSVTENERSAKQTIGLCALLAASFNLRRACINAVNVMAELESIKIESEADLAIARQKGDSMSKQLMAAVAQANGYDSEMFSAESA